MGRPQETFPTIAIAVPMMSATPTTALPTLAPLTAPLSREMGPMTMDASALLTASA